MSEDQNDIDGSGLGFHARRLASLIMSQIVCVPFARRPFQDLKKPEAYGLKNAVNLRIPVVTSDGTNPIQEEVGQLGAWLMSPLERDEVMDELNSCGRTVVDETEGHPTSAEHHEELEKLEKVGDIGSEDLVVLYLHGNAETRSQYHRRELYKIFQKMGYFVLAMDYRGYADSSSVYPNEDTMRSDAISAYHWLRGICHPDTKILVYGHSLGTAVASQLGAYLNGKQNGVIPPLGYVLEAPFNRMIDEVRTFRISKAAEMVLDLERLLRDSKCQYDTQSWVRDIKEPILILHAEDDNIVPYSLAKELHDNCEPLCDIDMVTYSEKEELRHENICFADTFVLDIKNFVSKCVEKSQQQEIKSS